MRRTNSAVAMKNDDKHVLMAFKAAFPYTVPIFAGFWFLGITYGVYMHSLGFSWVYPTVMAAVIFGGSLEFVVADMLPLAFDPLTALIVAFIVQARHLFYGISMLKKFSGTGWMKPYLIFGMCDETFSILYTTDPPKGIDRRWFMFFVTLLNQVYWVSGAAIGGLVGGMLHVQIRGLSFVMTALFTVIFINQWQTDKHHVSAIIGGVVSIACLAAFGADSFMLPTLVGLLVVFTVMRAPMEQKGWLD